MLFTELRKISKAYKRVDRKFDKAKSHKRRERLARKGERLAERFDAISSHLSTMMGVSKSEIQRRASTETQRRASTEIRPLVKTWDAKAREFVLVRS